MAVTINGDTGVTTPGISNSEGYTGDGLTIAAGAPSGAVQVDTSGNLGLGVTPSAWNAGYKAAQVGAGSLSVVPSDSSIVALSANRYAAPGETYIGTGHATVYQQTGGAHQWYTAPSGTAGNAISFTQAMTLDSSGNLLVGTTSNTSNAERGLFAASNSLQLAVQSTNTNGAQVRFYEGSTLRTMIGGIASTNAFQVQCGGSGGVSLANGGTSWTSLSDERTKDIIEPIANGLEKVVSLRSVIGKYKTDEEGARRSFLIAQDVQAVLPEAVIETTESIGSSETVLALSYTDVIPLLVAAIKELKAINDAQAQTIESLTARVVALEGQA